MTEENHQSKEITQLGALLGAKRKELHLSLKEVENATSIRASYLEAIEEGQIDQMIAGVYALGFIKQYAIFLGFSAEELMQKYPHAFTMPGEKHEFAYGIGTLEVRGSIGGGIKWFPNLIWSLVAVGVAVAAWYLARYLKVI